MTVPVNYRHFPINLLDKFTISNNMRAVVYDKPFSVSIHQVEKPKLSHPDDIIVKGSLRI
jgi:hypothetical protein